MEEEEEDIYEVDEILDYKTIRGNDYYYIHWKGFDRPEDNTWEPLENLGNCLGLVEAYFTKIGKKIPKNVETLLQYLNDDGIKEIDDINENIEAKEDGNIKEHNEIEEDSDKPSISSVENSEIQAQIEQSLNLFDKDYSSESKDDLTDSTGNISSRSDEKNTYQKDERSDYDDLDPPKSVKKTYTISSKGLRKIKERNVKESDSEPNSSLWDMHKTRFHVKAGEIRSRKDFSFAQSRQVELEVYQIRGKRQFGNKVEYLVEFRCAVDRLCWIREEDLNCDEEILRFERKKKTRAQEMPFSYFQHKYDNIPRPSPERISKARENLMRLRHELLGTPDSNLKNISSEELLEFYEQEAMQAIKSLD